MSIRCFALALAVLAPASARAQDITLACQGPKIESLRLPFSGRTVGSGGTVAAFEVVLNPTRQTAWINGAPARTAVFTDTEVTLSARLGGATIRIDRLSGAWSAAGGTGICTRREGGERVF